ncbi:hypothetical protein [Streptomyces sp. MUM 178J]|uniref:hypothetical protein n=1 Tax=Streptomyces sp. MUM 178J TaxID=2791991 RepID=UPI001F03AF2D|nr:hypothetical protein [Streptomyces sp. MUM 178J]WRQ81602.1 hypothetical protein I3F59_020845 [Streptomyces sp. MUM 178J]
MSFDQEWAEARAAVVASSGTRLNSADSGQADADLSVSQDKLGKIGSAAYQLHSRLQTDGSHARTSSSEAATMMAANGFQTGSALRTVCETWASQHKTLLAACAQISNHLDYSAASHAKEEADIEASFSVSKLNKYLK